MKRKVIFFVHSRCGGAERVLVTISKFLPDDEFDVSYQLFGNLNQIEAFLPRGRRRIWHHTQSHVSQFISIARRVIKDEKPDVVFASEMPYNWRLVLASMGSKARIVLRSENYVETQSFAQKVRLRIAYQFADSIIAQTEEMRQGIIRKLFVRPGKVITLPNPIDKDYINRNMDGATSPYSDRDGIKYVAVGRFARVKGFDILVRAFALVKEKQPHALLHIVGNCEYDPQYYRELLGLVDVLHLGNDVKFEGFQNNPYPYMRYADCYVLSSRNEGLPNVMLEALYLQTPVAATTCIPVIARIVKDGENGFLAETENPASLAQAMINASGMGRIVSKYAGTEAQSFVDLFGETTTLKTQRR